MASAPRVVAFGEIMLRLATPEHLRFSQADRLEMSFGGGEANVAVSLALLGLDAAFVTRMPENDIAEAAVARLRGYGVDTSRIVREGRRLGVYFLESGASQRPSQVVYDRAGSAIAEADRDDFDWPDILSTARWFHITGITPAISEAAAEISLMAVAAAKQAGATVSCDLNYRKKLWTTEQAGAVMGQLMKHVDYCIANEEDAEKVFGITAQGADVQAGKLDRAKYEAVAQQLTDRFDLKAVAITLRESYSASRNGWSAMLRLDGDSYFSRRYEIDIVDRVGGGDSFAAGLIYATLDGRGPQQSIDFAVAASCLKHTIAGDFNLVKLSEVEALAAGDASGRVQR